MTQLNGFQPAPKFRMRLNVGAGFDVPTGEFVKGQHGEAILNGGVPPVAGIGGRGNLYKSTIMMYWDLMILSRYLKAESVLLDTEETLNFGRLVKLADNMPVIGNGMLEEIPRFVLTSQDRMSGSKFYDVFKNAMLERAKASKDYKGTTPFVDHHGQCLEMFYPFVGGIDSFSGMNIEALEKLYNSNEVGESGLNVEAMKSAAAKSQLVIQLPGVLAKGGGFMLMSAHLGDEIKMDPYEPSKKKLSFLKGDVKFKRVPENWTFLTGVCWLATAATVLKNQTTKAAEYPRDSSDDLKGDTDLQLIQLVTLRNKYGLSGLAHEVVVSQTEGILPGLTAFHYIKKRGKFGIQGNDKNYYIALCPDISLSRTTVRHKIATHPKLQRALEICQEMVQLKEWHDLHPEAIPDPQTLYDTLKAHYDWDRLLNTRGHWLFNDDVSEDTLPYLSTWDLCRMYHQANGTLDRLGRWEGYHPYWYDQKDQ